MTGLIVKSTLILAVTALAAFVLRRHAASLVHRVWMAGLIAALVLPLASLWAPRWGSLPLLRFEFATPAGEWVGLVWLSGIVVGLSVMVAGTVRLAWLVLHSEPLSDSRWNAVAEDLRRRLNLRRPVQLLQSDNVRFLGTWGILRPHILVPKAARGWSSQRVRMVLAHELAHVARGDWPIQVLAETARAIYWFNPLFWMLVSRLRQEGEHAADDVVLGLGVSQAGYARELLEISRELGADRRQGPLLAIAQPSFLERRLVAVLDPKLSRVAAAPWATFVIMLLAIGVSVPLATLRDGSIDDTAGLAGATGLAGAVGLDDTAGPAGDGPVAAVDFVCPVTPTVTESPPNAELAAAMGQGPWHVNDDRSIWVWAQPYVAGRNVSAIWIRPEGTALSVSAERLDAGAPPVEATFNCCFPQLFKSGGIEFPTPGCWRVDATAGDRQLSFVTEVSRR